MKCAAHLSTLAEFMKIGLYDYARDSWRYIFRECPASSKNIYIHGVKIYKYLLDKSSNDEKMQQLLLDTLMQIYDKRIQYFDEEGFVNGRKGIDFLRYSRNDPETGLQYLEKSIDLMTIQAEEPVLLLAMKTAGDLYQNIRMKKTDFLGLFSKISGIIEEKLKKDSSNEKLKKVQQEIDTIATNNGILK